MISFLKVPPTTWVMQFKGGRVKREGAGLSFFYWAPTTVLVQVPMASTDTPFVFNEVTQDFQALTVQGQMTWRVAEPRKLAALLDYTVDSRGRYQSEDPQKLEERLVNAAQVLTRAVTQTLPLREALVSSELLSSAVLKGLRQHEAVRALGIEVLAFSLVSLKPAPEMGRALEAEAREALQRKSDEAIYDRRRSAVEQERKIKETELNTEVMVEEKKRHIRETQMAAEIAIEAQRATLIDQRVENEKKAADSQAYALEATLKPVQKLDWKVLQALGGNGRDPRMMIAVAFQQLAENAQKIGELNMSPDLLQSLMGPSTLPNGVKK